MNSFALGLIIIFLAGFVQGVTGFGFGLIAVPLLSYFLPLKSIVPLVVIYSLITNLFIIRETGNYIKLKEIRLIIIFGIIGIPIGTCILKIIDPNILKFAVGVVIVVTVAAMIQGSKIQIKNKFIASGVTGFLSGLLNGSISMSGPPVVLFLTNKGSEKNVFRANLTLYAIVTNIITICLFMINGAINQEVIKYLIYLLPGLFIGIIIGTLTARKINEVLFRKIILALIMSTGVITVITTGHIFFR